MVVSLWLWPTAKSTATKIHVKRWQSWWPCRYGGATWGASPDAAHPWLHAKPLDASIRQVPAPYCPSSQHGQQFWMKHKNTDKTQLLPCFLMIDRRKKAKQFWDPKRTLYSRHWCNKLHTNMKNYCLSWRAQLHFELSNVVNGHKIQKVINLERSPKKPLGQIWPYSG